MGVMNLGVLSRTWAMKARLVVAYLRDAIEVALELHAGVVAVIAPVSQ